MILSDKRIYLSTVKGDYISLSTCGDLVREYCSTDSVSDSDCGT